MSVDFTLRLSAPAAVTGDEAKRSFYWLAGGQSSFTTQLDPNLSSLGPVPALNIDLVRIAVAVYAADHTVPRAGGGSSWNQRDIEVTVPVSDVAKWSRVAGDLNRVVAFLTGDRWTINFNGDLVEGGAPAEPQPIPPRRVVLLSGGADSAVGALISRSQLGEDESHLLVSHFSARTLPPIQRQIAAAVEQLIPGPAQEHLQIHMSRNAKRIDGTTYFTEPTSRSRSLLFLALGLAAASVYDVPLWIPENGFASLNPPLGPERLGSVSTRTTHPAFLDGLRHVLMAAGAHHMIENPFASSTKGEMFCQAADLVKTNRTSTYLSGTNSCAHTGQRAFGVSPSQSCGVCFGCVIRRSAFSAAGVQDATVYISAGINKKLQAWLDVNSVEPAVRSFIKRGVRERDLIALSLPTSYRLADARDLCERGIKELVGLAL